jgi:hypothetical protein
LLLANKNMTLNQCGLVCNMIGTLIIAYWGLPNWYYSEDGGSFVTRNAGSEKGVKYNKSRKLKAYLGLALLFIGFVLEFADSFIHAS